MPEGDTIHRSAHHLSLALTDRSVARYRAYRPELLQANREGHTVTSVEARGKNLLIHFEDGRSLYSHMKMTGAWHVYRPGEAWRYPEHLGRVVIENRDYVAVCFSAPDIELLTSPEIERHPVLSALGPDLLGETFDLEKALSRFREAGDHARASGVRLAIGDAVLDQRIVAGMGNVWKSEMLFLTRIDPFAPVSDLTSEKIRTLLRETRKWMRRNLTTAQRTTRTAPGSPVWVYGRGGRPCFRCEGRIEVRGQGDYDRNTYYCAHCQDQA